MGGHSFTFKQFHIEQERCAMKVGTDSIVLGSWVPVMGAKRILDIGTGTGILALMLAQRTSQSVQIDAVELDPDAVKQAEENVNGSPWRERIRVIRHDIRTFQAPDYDLIISNPPYVTEDDMLDLPSEYKHEPSLALVAGKHGLSIVSRILAQAFDHLNDGGGLLCEVGQCKPALEKMFPQLFDPKLKKVQWFQTANSVDEVFYVKKEHLHPSLFKQVK